MTCTVVVLWWTQWVVLKNNQSYLPCKCIAFEADFYTYLSGFVDRDSCVSNSYVSGVATENIYLLSFIALVFIMLRAEYLLYKYFFPTF